jgi:hypothetical protein
MDTSTLLIPPGLAILSYKLYQCFSPANFGTSLPEVTAIPEEENKEVDSDPVASPKPNRKYNSSNEMYHFLVRY